MQPCIEHDVCRECAGSAAMECRGGTDGSQTRPWSKPDSNSRSHPLTRRQTHGSDRMNGAERDTVVGSGSLVTLDPGAAKREITRSFPVRPWALSQARGA